MKIDFSNISEFKTVPAGKYPARVTEMVLTKANSGNKMFNWTFTITDGEYKGRKIWTRTVLVEDSLWVLRNYLIALGIEVPKGAVDVDPQKIIGKYCIIETEVDIYQGKEKSVIINVFPASDDQGKSEGDKLLEESLPEKELDSEEVSEELEQETEDLPKQQTLIMPTENESKTQIVEEKTEKKSQPSENSDSDLINFLNQ